MSALTAESLHELYTEFRKCEDEELKAEILARYEELVDSLPTSYIGPIWQRDEDGEWILPKHTLGWQVIGWCHEYMGGFAGEALELTLEQVRFLLWWYAVDENGVFVYRTAVLQRCKGWGKDPVVAILCLIEFVGPSQFSHWDENGEPVGKPHPNAWVQIAAVSADQTKNTVRLFPSLITDRMKAEFGIKAGEELWRAHGGKVTMEIASMNPATIQGNRTTFVVLNETHEWKSSNRGTLLYDTIDGNVTKVDGRYVAITNAHMPGQDSVAERMRNQWQDIQDGLAEDVRMMIDSIEADPRAPMTSHAMRIILPKVRGDAWWLPIEGTINSALATSRSVEQSRRMYYNQVVASSDALYTEAEWKAGEDRDLSLRLGDEITLGFDGGKTEDATALVALRVRDMFAMPLAVWESEGEGWEIDRHAVNSAVNEAFRKYSVVGFYADVALWESYIDDWHEAYGEGLKAKAAPSGNAIAWDMRGSQQRVATAHERLVATIQAGMIKHNGDAILRRHVLNAVRRYNNFGLIFGKESARSANKIDAYAALFLAYEALHDYRTKRKPEKKRTGRVWM